MNKESNIIPASSTVMFWLCWWWKCSKVSRFTSKRNLPYLSCLFLHSYKFFDIPWSFQSFPKINGLKELWLLECTIFIEKKSQFFLSALQIKFVPRMYGFTPAMLTTIGYFTRSTASTFWQLFSPVLLLGGWHLRKSWILFATSIWVMATFSYIWCAYISENNGLILFIFGTRYHVLLIYLHVQ